MNDVDQLRPNDRKQNQDLNSDDPYKFPFEAFETNADETAPIISTTGDWKADFSNNTQLVVNEVPDRVETSSTTWQNLGTAGTFNYYGGSYVGTVSFTVRVNNNPYTTGGLQIVFTKSGATTKTIDGYDFYLHIVGPILCVTQCFSLDELEEEGEWSAQVQINRISGSGTVQVVVGKWVSLLMQRGV